MVLNIYKDLYTTDIHSHTSLMWLTVHKPSVMIFYGPNVFHIVEIVFSLFEAAVAFLAFPKACAVNIQVKLNIFAPTKAS